MSFIIESKDFLGYLLNYNKIIFINNYLFVILYSFYFCFYQYLLTDNINHDNNIWA